MENILLEELMLMEASKSYDDVSYVIVKELYKVIAKCVEKNDNKFRAHIAKFINDHHNALFDVAPYDRIYYNQSDIDAMFKSLGITEKEVLEIIRKCYFFDVPGYTPQCAKEPYVLALMMCIRYYLKNNKRKNAELTTIYMAFSGKFYASLHAGLAFPVAPPSSNKAAMDYVVNNMLTDKYDLKREGSVFGAIKSLCITWLNTYEHGNNNTNHWSIVDEGVSDDNFGKLLQQIRDREKAFLMNIATLYYEACKNKYYLNYETDNLDEDNFRLTSNDSATAARITDNAIMYLTSNYVSLEICNKCKDENIKATEIKDIMETILADNNNIPSIQRVINIMICDFMVNNPGKSVGSIDFVAYTIKAKPNTKVAYILEMKSTILKWLDDNSPTYRKRKSRLATQNSYYRAILMYLTLVVNKVAR